MDTVLIPSKADLETKFDKSEREILSKSLKVLDENIERLFYSRKARGLCALTTHLELNGEQLKESECDLLMELFQVIRELNNFSVTDYWWSTGLVNKRKEFIATVINLIK